MNDPSKINQELIEENALLKQRIGELEKSEADRKQMETMLQNSEECFRIGFRSNPAPTFISTVSEGCYLDVNNSGLSLLGYTREEMIGHTIRELSIWENHDDRSPLIARLIKERSLKNLPITLRTKGGENKEVLWSCELIKLNNEDVILSLLLDTTDYKRAEEALRESEQRWMDIIDFLPDATMAIDLEGKIIAWNRAMEEMTGVTAKDMMGKGNYEYVIPFYGIRRPVLVDLVLEPDQKIERHYSILKKEKDLVIVEAWVPCLKGRQAYLWGKASPFYDGKGNIVGAIESIRDITERKNDEEILRKREKDLELKRGELQDVNTALRVLLKQRDGDRSEMEEKILSNIKLLVLPLIEKLKSYSDPKVVSCVNVIDSNLQDIISPFSYKLSSKFLNMSNKEIAVANLIKEEKTTKEITEILNSSLGTINVHRCNIRKKLGLTKTQNLCAYLSSLNQH